MYHTNDLLYDQNISSIDSRGQQFCNSELEISISARNLLNRDIVSKSDPQCIVYQFNGSQYQEICRTEVIKDNLNPDWVKKVVIPYQFNVKQQLRFEIFDYDPYTQNEFLGRADLTLAEVVAANKGIYRQTLKTGSQSFKRISGEIWLQSEEISSNKQLAHIQFSAHNLG